MIRHLLAGIALLALVALWWTPREVEVSGEVFLKTPGAAEVPDVRVRIEIADESSPLHEVVPDLATLLRRHPAVDRLRIEGYGLPEWEWSNFHGRIEFDADALEVPPGIRHLSWPRRIVLGEEWVIEGVAQDLATLHLDGPGGRAASTVPEDGAFTLRTRPRALGRFLYHLRADSGEEWGIDVEVVPPRPPTVLWLEDAPSFEARHFKEWLVRRGGRVVLVSRVSRDRLRTERGGFDPREAGEGAERSAPASPNDLDLYDFVVIDPEYDPPRGLTAWVREGGGLLLRVDESDDIREIPRRAKSFSIQQIDDLEHWVVAPRFSGGDPFPELSIAAREVVETDATTVPLLEDEAGRLLAVWRPQGLGREGLGLIHDTYRWRLEGKEEAYGRYWSRLLETLARPAEPERLLVPAGPLFVDEPIDLQLLEASETVTSPSGQRVSLATHAGRARWWPREEGWHQIADAWVYVHADEWETWSAVRSIEATRRAALRPVLHRVQAGSEGKARSVSTRFFLWIFFVASSVSLWAYERFRNTRSLRLL